MHSTGPDLRLSATDLFNFLSCRHRTALDMAKAAGKRSHAYYEDPLLDILIERGNAHEARYVESLRAAGLTVVDIRTRGDGGAEATLGAMREGAHVIVQGTLADGRWHGRTDILRRVETPSAFGAWSYEVYDTKLARETRAGTILQLGLYSDMLARAQESTPEHFHVVTPDPVQPTQTYRVNDFAAYFRLVRRQMEVTVAQDWETIAAANYPEPVDHCDVCHWSTDCRTRRREDDHLSLVAGISRVQRRELEARSVTTLTGLAQLPLPITPKPKRGSVESYVRAREQARVQLESRDQAVAASRD